MARLVYSALASIDGYIEDSAGGFDWAAPDDEVHAFVNDLERDIGTYLYGRRMYETMRFWEALPPEARRSDVSRDYATVWQGADKIVFSTTLRQTTTRRTRLEPTFDADMVRRLKAERDRDISIGGPALAAQALAAGLVDEVSLFFHPIAVGAGKPALPVATPLRLELREERRFVSGVVYLRYEVREPA